MDVVCCCPRSAPRRRRSSRSAAPRESRLVPRRVERWHELVHRELGLDSQDLVRL